MIQVKNLSLYFGEQAVFDDVNCLINPDQRIGIVGRNGAGKSTFLKVLSRHIRPDSGTIETQKGFHIAYMPQDVVLQSNKTVFDEAVSVFQELYDMEQEKNHIEVLMEQKQDHELINRYSELEYELLSQNFNEKKADARKMLAGLGFDDTKQQALVSELSVGWRMRIVLAKLLLQKADFYLFDEPTNHLDLSTKQWFLQFLKQNDFGYLLVCHDRYFLDQACSITYEFALGKLTIYHGNYSYFVKQKEWLTEQREVEHERQQKDIKKKEDWVNRFKAKASMAKRAQSVMRALDKVERIELGQTQKVMSLRFLEPAKSGQLVLKVSDIAYSFDKPIFKNVSFEVERGDKVALIAPNGTGKSTLFNIIAQKLPLQKGTFEYGYNVSIALFDQDQDKVLRKDKTIFEEVSSSTNASDSQVRSILGAMLFAKDDTSKKCGVLSGGERNRVAMSKVALSGANVLLLDEPTNHLDIESKEIILHALQEFKGTIIFVSHDQDFVNQLATKIIELRSDGSTLYLGNYDSYLALKEARGALGVQASQKNTQKHVAQKNNPDYELLHKNIKQLEKKIEQEEKELERIVKNLESAEYGTQHFTDLEKKYSALQKNLAEKNEEWERLHKEIEE